MNWVKYWKSKEKLVTLLRKNIRVKCKVESIKSKDGNKRKFKVRAGIIPV